MFSSVDNITSGVPQGSILASFRLQMNTDKTLTQEQYPDDILIAIPIYDNSEVISVIYNEMKLLTWLNDALKTVLRPTLPKTKSLFISRQNQHVLPLSLIVWGLK